MTTRLVTNWSGRSRKDFVVFLAMALPNLALIATFTYWPLINNIYYSTLDWTLGSASATVVGLQNYVTFFTGEDAPKVLGTTAVFTVVTVGGSMVLGLLVALALNSKVRGTTFARSVVFAPYVLSGVGVGLVWLFIFDPGYGVLAWILRGLGQQSPQWMNDPQLSLVMVMIVYVWKNLATAPWSTSPGCSPCHGTSWKPLHWTAPTTCAGSSTSQFPCCPPPRSSC